MLCLIENSQIRATRALMDQCHWFLVMLTGTLALLCCPTLVLCFLREPELGNCLCYLAESTSSCVCLSFDISDCLYRQKPSSSQLVYKTKSLFQRYSSPARGKKNSPTSGFLGIKLQPSWVYSDISQTVLRLIHASARTASVPFMQVINI